MDVRIAEDWKEILAEEFSKPYFEQLTAFVKAEYAQGGVFPKVWHHERKFSGEGKSCCFQV